MACGGAAEQGLLMWASAMAERGLGVSKQLGDLLGTALFVGLEGLSHTLFGCFEAHLNVGIVMLVRFVIAIASYLLITLQENAGAALFAIGVTGFAVAQHWPGFLSVAAEIFPLAGNWMFGALALGGDIGCAGSVAMIGRIADTEWAAGFLDAGHPEESALRSAVFVNGFFAIVGVLPAAFIVWWRRCRPKDEDEADEPEGVLEDGEDSVE
jgi:hypothetical protein